MDTIAPMHPLTLRFPSDGQEREFRREMGEASRRPSRVTIFVVTFLFLIYAVLDRAVLPADVARSLLGVRIAVGLALVGVAATTWHSAWPAFRSWAIVASMLVATAGLLAIMALQGPGLGLPIWSGIGIAILGAATVFRLRVVWVVPLAAAVGLAWLATALTTAVPREELLNGVFFIPTASILGVLAAYTIERYARHAFLHDRAVQEERARADRLLLNVLPAGVAERLKRDPGRIAELHPKTTILFADIADFTALSATMAPEALVDLLDEVFTEFDRIVDEKGLEKIKTIGDAYMAVAGAPEECVDHVDRVMEAAIAMREEVARRLRSGDGIPLAIRIGIDTGPVVAGVIGRSRFIYDLWGDAVNTASRMESHGLPGEIHVTGAVRDRLEGRYAFRSRGEIEVKGKGRMETWLLEGRVVNPFG